MNRIDADISTTLAGDGSGNVFGVRIYIIDTGIRLDHADLNVVGGSDFTGGGNPSDFNGHGTDGKAWVTKVKPKTTSVSVYVESY